MNDPVNYVRQGALLASALVLVQHTEFTSSKVKDIRQLYAKVIGDKHEDVMAKFGAILAQGIIDAGGRNVTISLGAQPLSLTGICTHRNYRPQFRSEGTFITIKFSRLICLFMNYF